MIEVILKDGGLYIISEEQIRYWESIYEELDVRTELGLIKELWSSNAIPRRTAKNVSKYINRYLSKEKNNII